jgi:NADH:ubiquinone oxidoreductase subunit 2 (subunit N)
MIDTLFNTIIAKIIIDTLSNIPSIDTLSNIPPIDTMPLFVPEIPPIRLEICERITELVLMRQPKPIFALVVPEVIIGLTLVMAFGNFCCNGNYNKNDNITNTGRRLYLGIGYLIALFVYYLDFEEYQMSSSDIIDTSFSVLMSKILLICFSILLLFLKVNLFKQVYYAAVIMFFGLGLVSAANITLFYICFEALSLLAYGLLAAPKTVGATEATLKYYGFGLIVSACLGFGITALSIELISQNLNDITLYIPTTIDNISNIPFLLAFSIFLILVAFAHKLSLFPFHSVLPDIYEASS